MSKNLLYGTAQLLFEQMQVCKTAKGNDLDREAKRMDTISRGAQALSEIADKQIRVLYATGFLPDENVLVDDNEVKLVNAKRNLLPSNRKKENFMDEFIRK